MFARGNPYVQSYLTPGVISYLNIRMLTKDRLYTNLNCYLGWFLVKLVDDQENQTVVLLSYCLLF